MAWDVIRGLCAGLEHAHDAGIIHADFKPGNVFVSPKNAPKILDFGLARAVQLSETQGEDTLFDPARLAALTPAYASREMLNGDNPETRDDLYSLGIVIYLILTGHHPYGRLSADDAAREGLQPEKPRRLSRRQWRVVERCLRFNRQDRPRDVQEVQKFLLEPSPWRSRSALAAAGAFLLALSLNYFIGDAELTEVKQEVRQTTLLDAQVARINALLAESVMTRAWETSVAQELAGLAQLAGSQVASDELLGRLSEMYTRQIAATQNLRLALDLFTRGSEFGELRQARRVLQIRTFNRLQELLDRQDKDQRWLAQLRSELAGMHNAFPGSSYLAELRLDVADVLERAVLETESHDEFPHAQSMLYELEPILFDAQSLEELRNHVDAAKDRTLAAGQAREAAERRQLFAARLDEVLDESCLRLDVAEVAAVHRSWLLVDPMAVTLSQSKIVDRIGNCLQQLADLDRDRGVILRSRAEQLFGPEMFTALPVDLDPCALNYLVGNGAKSGRRGYCADRLTDDLSGPRLVVLPAENGEGRFAMTKHEISWAQFNEFCELSSECAALAEAIDQIAAERLPDRPVRGVTLQSAQSYASWLSEKTGFTYRLPTFAEWQWAARGEPDPNRNCRLSVGGVARGLVPVAINAGLSNDYGLVHMLGNVQEWVLTGDGVSAVGGAYSDPIGECVSQTNKSHAGKPDSATGFRLVREIS
jgi:hypothetical protein